MPQDEPPVRWAPRVALAKIRRLYQTDAAGIHNEELIDEVGFGLYARCQSILTVTEAAAGRVACPECGAIVRRAAWDDPGETLRCDCGWETTWARYHRTWQHQELYGGGAVDACQQFVRDWPGAETPQRKMLLIDQLIHRWHWQARADRALGRPAGVNLIEGSRAQVLALLDELTYGPASSDTLYASRDTWQDAWQQVRRAQRRATDGSQLPHG
jgi:predicted RNA-binding Zn-ribbon protein involved in translation (DUF1610 family)